jgi:heat shock protein HtpX
VNNLKTALWMVALTLLLVVAGRLVAGTVGMVIALGIALVMNGVAYWFSDRLALRMARAHEVSRAGAPTLHAFVDRLAAQFGVPRPRVYVSPDPTPNAFATGRSPKHAAIVVNQGLLDLLAPEEAYGVLAHEFAHVANRDILISSVVAVLAGAITVIANIAQWSMWFGGGQEDEDGGGGILGLVALLLTAILAPIAAMLIQLAVSRSREYQADRTAALVSGDPRGLASALRKLDRASHTSPSPLAQPAFAHLYIVNPISGRALAGLFSTHPPVEERIARLDALATRAAAPAR